MEVSAIDSPHIDIISIKVSFETEAPPFGEKVINTSQEYQKITIYESSLLSAAAANRITDAINKVRPIGQ